MPTFATVHISQSREVMMKTWGDKYGRNGKLYISDSKQYAGVGVYIKKGIKKSKSMLLQLVLLPM
jgi:hypothetical protein